MPVISLNKTLGRERTPSPLIAMSFKFSPDGKITPPIFLIVAGFNSLISLITASTYFLTKLPDAA